MAISELRFEPEQKREHPIKSEFRPKRVEEMSGNEKIDAVATAYPQVFLLYSEGLNDMQMQEMGREMAESLLGGRGTYSVSIPEAEKGLPTEQQSVFLKRVNKGFPKRIVDRALELGYQLRTIPIEEGSMNVLTIPALEPKNA